MICSNDYDFGPGARCRSLDFTLRFSNMLVKSGVIWLTPSFLSFVPALIFVLLSLQRLVFVLPTKARRLLPLGQIPWSGRILLVTRVALCAYLIAANAALWAEWEKTTGLRGEYSGWLAAASEVVAAVG
jgi:hypothetical protein